MSSSQRKRSASSRILKSAATPSPSAPSYPRLADQLDRVIDGFMVKQPIVDIITFAEDPNYLGEKLFPVQKEILQEFFNPEKNYEELLIIAGRRSSKTFITSIIATYLSYLWLECPDPYHLFQGLVARGEEVCILCVATKEEQATILLDKVQAKILKSPYFQAKILKSTNYEVQLPRNMSIMAVTSNSASEVGKTALAVLFDEIGKYGEEEGTRDGEEVYDSLAPSVAQFASNRKEILKRAAGDPSLEKIIRYLGKIVSISTPMAETGILWRLYNTALRLPSILMYQRPTWMMNPNFPRDGDYMKNEYAKHPETFDREFGAQFAKAIGGMFTAELINNCIGQSLRPWDRYYNYRAAVDSSTRSDGFAFAIAHISDTGKVIIDQLKIWKPRKGGRLDWDTIVPEIKNDLNAYHVEQLYYDQYQSEAIRLHFKGYAILETTFTMPYKMKIYGALEKLMKQGNIEYPAHETLIAELKALERKYNGENFTVHHPDKGPITTDDGPDAVANLAHQLFEALVESRDADEDDYYDSGGRSGARGRDEDDNDDMGLFAGGGYA